MLRKAFTIIELVVVISIIALLIAVLVPGWKKVKEQAKSLSQKCQLREIEIGLHGWANEHDMEYPDSHNEFFGSGSVTGAQKLCEALVGRDLQGFDSNSSWNPWKDENSTNPEIYPAEPMHNRYGHYVELTKFNTFQLGQLYDMSLAGGFPAPYGGNTDENGNIDNSKKPCYVFTDNFKRKTITLPNDDTIKVGTPILYYKANSTKESQWSNMAPSSASIFNFFDNETIMQYWMLNETDKKHPYHLDFLAMGQNGNPRSWVEDILAPSPPWNDQPAYVSGMPYNRDTFLLLSAGADGLFGTDDDIWNISGK